MFPTCTFSATGEFSCKPLNNVEHFTSHNREHFQDSDVYSQLDKLGVNYKIADKELALNEEKKECQMRSRKCIGKYKTVCDKEVTKRKYTTFRAYQDVNNYRGNIINGPRGNYFNGSKEQIMTECLNRPECVGFTHNGGNTAYLLSKFGLETAKEKNWSIYVKTNLWK